MTAVGANPILEINSMPTKRSLLSRIWPFLSKRIHHRTFGALKPYRNGNYLRTKADFEPVKKRVWLVIRADKAGPTHTQEKVYRQIEKHYAAMLPRVLKALFAEYQRVRHAQRHVPWPEVTKPTELMRIIPLDAIWLEEGQGHPFVFSYQSELDKDHEFHVFFRDGKLQNVAFEH
jgi:hypothetical protein